MLLSLLFLALLFILLHENHITSFRSQLISSRSKGFYEKSLHAVKNKNPDRFNFHINPSIGQFGRKLIGFIILPLYITNGMSFSDNPLSSIANAAYTSQASIPTQPMRGYQAKSGLKYFELEESKEGPTPRYGQLVAFRYSTLYRPIDSQTYQIIDDSDYGKPNPGDPFLHKHGNNRLIRAVDEAIHTMHVGSKRRIIIPPTLGYVDVGIGPVPLTPDARQRLGKVIDLAAANKGELLMDLEVVMIADDENDQGYYDDDVVTNEEMQGTVKELMKRRDMKKFDQNSLFGDLLDEAKGKEKVIEEGTVSK